MTRLEEITLDVVGMINAGFDHPEFSRDAPYPSTDRNGRVAYWHEFAPADIVASIKTMYGPEWARYVAAASALTIH